jgi:hypothetical protein
MEYDAKNFQGRLVRPLLAIGIAHGQHQKTANSSAEPSTPEVIEQFNDDEIAELSKQIACKEDQPAEVVFKNIKIFTGCRRGIC